MIGLDLSEGAVLAGKYRVERLLGQGGMGMVLAAHHVQLDERVAIKLMLPEAAASSDAVARFVREARAAAKIRSEHVARVSDVGTLENGQPFMVMEYLDGSDLGGLLAQRGRLPLEEATSYLLQASEALAEAHALGIVHRDLKPGNLFLARRRDGSPLVKVLDFGISKVSNAAQSATDSARTKTSALMGSPLYMSPEQMTSSRDVDARSDVWALGVILFELVTGQPPFNGETLPQVCGLVLQGPTPSVLASSPDLPPALDAIIQRCLAKSPAERYASVAELAQALAPFAPRHSAVSVERISRLLPNGAEWSAPPPAHEPVQARTGVGTNMGFGTTSASAQKSSGLLWAGLGATVLLLAAGAGFFVLKGPTATAEPLAAPASTASAVSTAIAPPPPATAAPPPPLAEVSLTPPPSSPAESASSAPRAQAAARPRAAKASTAQAPAPAAPAPAASPKKSTSLGGRL